MADDGTWAIQKVIDIPTEPADPPQLAAAQGQPFLCQQSRSYPFIQLPTPARETNCGRLVGNTEMARFDV